MATKSPIQLLQELLVNKKLPIPIYIFDDISQTRLPQFRCTVQFDGRQISCTGPSKKHAKQNCAKKALDVLRQQENDNNYVTITKVPETHIAVNYIGDLNAYSSINNFRYPTYSNALVSDAGFTVTCTFLDFECVGRGTSRKAAKQDSARKVLDGIKSKHITSIFTEKFNLDDSNKLKKDCLVDDLHRKLKIFDDNERIPKVTLRSSNTHKPVICSLETLLTRYGLKYSIRTNQVNPLILTLKMENENFVLTECGSSYEDTKEQLLKSALAICRYKKFNNICCSRKAHLI